ncbi:MAG: BamA/TamA family outer membrane protein [Flavobacteriales bacterium]|jgi:outer membrane protein insertion porin family|nr:BamA/TamA family outer membrane protein [Flavobacteriales bacterium]
MKFYICAYVIFYALAFWGQQEEVYLVEGIKVEGNTTTSEDAIITLSGLKIGEYIRIPSPKVQYAVQALWDEGVFDDIVISKQVRKEKVFLTIRLKEYQLLGELFFEGVNDSEKKKVLNNKRVQVLKRYSPHALKTINHTIKSVLQSKGYRSSEVLLTAQTDTLKRVNLNYRIEKGERSRIRTIKLLGGLERSKEVLNKLGKLDQAHPFKQGKYYVQSQEELVQGIIKVYQEKGFLDVEVDSVAEFYEKNNVDFSIYLKEGNQYWLKDIAFNGCELFTEEELKRVVASLVGKVYAKPRLEERLFFEEKRNDVTSRYVDNGYANLKLNFVEQFEGDSIVKIIVEVKEGEQYSYGKIAFKGNVRTKDKILHQTVITASGDQFSRSKIILSQNKLMQLDYFIPEAFDVDLNIDTLNKKVDVTYILKERISDRFLVSGGFDGTYLIGTLGFDFKNFELSDVFRKGARWNPLPAGGGQHLSIKAQSDAQNYYGFSFLFEEPRLKNKPVGIGLSSDYAFYNDGAGGTLSLVSSQIGVSHFPMKNKPFLRLSHQLNYQYYQPENYSLFGFMNGFYNAMSYNVSLVNQTTDNAFFPTTGRLFKLEGRSTIPYSLLKTIDQTASTQENYKWLEYYKLKASFKLFKPLDKKRNTILASKFGVGALGRFTQDLDVVPFGRFEMGGTGITNYSINANDIIGLRGYDVGSLSSDGGDPLALKMSVELRRKLITFEKWMLTGHAFYENGNTFAWGDQFSLNHSTGIGGRLYIPMLGVVGVDCGWGMSKQNFDWKKPTVQLTIGLDVGDF